MQAQALRRLGIWKRAALSLMVIGGLSAYTGFVTDPNIVRGVFGILTAAVSGMAAYVITLGSRRGKRMWITFLRQRQSYRKDSRGARYSWLPAGIITFKNFMTMVK